ncbi:MAG: hypothetical protein P857_311 [Candidatus Xenolissoclinum pacificiensis L6]|uniref:Ubiquinone biosynthesis COQ7 family protein n=1 Tax=Candidatus Xenolissoclinum pacificiensis L6 TaxID=1401685 RepID=W2UZ33_9RICK|nr:MAG: hypothetical protein P857_311 [Candidatus Xenolissoclinum pacificiensis L6]
MSQVLRVDHAGEFGAVKIYENQLRLYASDSNYQEILKEMKLQEDRHLKYFSEKLYEMKIRPSFMLFFWDVLASCMGIMTAFLGKDLAMLCTVAVEDVIEKHYQQQILLCDDILYSEYDQSILKIKEKIAVFRQEELEHHNTADNNIKDDISLYKRLIFKIIQYMCIFAIKISRYI